MAEFRSIMEPIPHKKANPFHKQNIIQKKKQVYQNTPAFHLAGRKIITKINLTKSEIFRWKGSKLRVYAIVQKIQ